MLQKFGICASVFFDEYKLNIFTEILTSPIYRVSGRDLKLCTYIANR